MKNKKTYRLVLGAVIAALYAALTYLSGMFGIAYGNIQFRFSEALTILAAYTPAAIPGLTIGCFLGNLGSPYGMLDIILGTLATLIAASLSYVTRNIRFKNLPLLSAFFPVITNAIIIGLEIAIFLPEGFTFYGFIIQALWIGLGELVVCYFAGIPLAIAIDKTDLKKYINK